MTSRKKRPLVPSRGMQRDASLIVIATEGQETEKQYFQMFKSTRLKVLVLPTSDGQSAPQHVLKRLSKFKKDYDLKSFDQLWLMVDVDRWKKKDLADVCSKSRQKRFRMAVSNPCFEVWLYLHHSDEVKDPWTAQEAKAALKKMLGSYNSSNIDIEVFRPHVEKALTRARKLDKTPKERWPSGTGTRVHLVVQEILDRGIEVSQD